MGDINGDGELDIAAGNNVANPSSPTGTVTVPYGNGSGAFTVGNVIAVNYGLGIAVADINKDTHLDIVEAGTGSGWRPDRIRWGSIATRVSQRGSTSIASRLKGVESPGESWSWTSRVVSGRGPECPLTAGVGVAALRLALRDRCAARGGGAEPARRRLRQRAIAWSRPRRGPARVPATPKRCSLHGDPRWSALLKKMGFEE